MAEVSIGLSALNSCTHEAGAQELLGRDHPHLRATSGHPQALSQNLTEKKECFLYFHPPCQNTTKQHQGKKGVSKLLPRLSTWAKCQRQQPIWEEGPGLALPLDLR